MSPPAALAVGRPDRDASAVPVPAACEPAVTRDHDSRLITKLKRPTVPAADGALDKSGWVIVIRCGAVVALAGLAFCRPRLFTGIQRGSLTVSGVTLPAPRWRLR